jgi:hypothetical protein
MENRHGLCIDLQVTEALVTETAAAIRLRPPALLERCG